MKYSKKYLSIVPVILLVSALAGCGKSSEELLKDAQVSLNNNDYQAATVNVKNVLQEQPNNKDARFLLGRIYLATESYANAVKELGKAKEMGFPDDQVLPLLLKAMVKSGQAQQVVDYKLPASGVNLGTLATIEALRAQAFLVLGKRDDAEDALQAAGKWDSNASELMLTNALKAWGERNRDKALEWVETALKRNEKSIEALYMKAALLQEMARNDEATKIYERIVGIDPRQYRAHLGLSVIFLQTGNIDAAEKAQRQAEKLAANVPMVLYNRSILDLQGGNPKKAEETLQKLLRISPNHLPSLLVNAMTNYMLGNYEQSSKDAQIVLNRIPNNVLAARILAANQMKRGDVKSSLSTLDAQTKLNPGDLKLLLLASQVSLQAQELGKAKDYLHRAASIDASNTDVKQRQADFNLAAKHYDEAVADLQQANKLSDKLGPADFKLVLLHLQLRRYDQALSALDGVEKKQPRLPSTRYLRGVALLGKQDRVGARREFEQALVIFPTFMPATRILSNLDLEDGRIDAARARFHAHLAKDKASIEAMMALAGIAANNREEREYVKWLEAASDTDAKNIQVKGALARYYISKKEGTKAENIAKEAVKSNPASIEALNLLGVTQLALGNAQAAISTFTTLSQKAPKSAESLLPLALAQATAKQAANARTTLQKALRINPQSIKVLDALMRLELSENMYDAASSVARQIQTAHPRSVVGHDGEGDIEIARKRFSLAAKAYERALNLDAGAPAFLKFHRALVLAKDFKLADSRLLEWLRKNPRDILVKSYAGEYYSFLKRNRDAAVQYEDVAKLTPNNVGVLNNLANIYAALQDSRALPTAERALKVDPKRPELLDTLGWILVQQGQYPRALDYLKSAANIAPNIGIIRYHYGVGLIKSGNKAEARRELEAAISLGKFDEVEEARSLIKTL